MTQVPARQEVIRRIRSAMNTVEGLSSADILSVEEMIEGGEVLIAFETLCTQVYEWGLRVEPDVIRDLEDLGVALSADPKYVEYLWRLTSEE